MSENIPKKIVDISSTKIEQIDCPKKENFPYHIDTTCRKDSMAIRTHRDE